MHHSQRKGCSCHGKVVYRSAGEAEKAQRKKPQGAKTGRHRVVPYRCNGCQGYHLTHQDAPPGSPGPKHRQKAGPRLPKITKAERDRRVNAELAQLLRKVPWSPA